MVSYGIDEVERAVVWLRTYGYCNARTGDACEHTAGTHALPETFRWDDRAVVSLPIKKRFWVTEADANDPTVPPNRRHGSVAKKQAAAGGVGGAGAAAAAGGAEGNDHDEGVAGAGAAWDNNNGDDV